jgi:hypothetical protein
VNPGPTNRAGRTLAAELRAVAEGHRAFLDRDHRGPFVKVVSDTVRGKWYRVTAHAAADQPIVFECEPRGTRAYEDDHLHATAQPGHLPCKHCGVAARRLERQGMAEYVDGAWVATLAADTAATVRRLPEPADPFAGFPQT